MTTAASAAPAGESPAQLLYADIENELALTRRTLERFPSGHSDWSPHEKSMTLGRLAAHLADLPRYGTAILATDGMDFATAGYTLPTADSAVELLAVFDARAAELRSAIAAATFDSLAETWTLRNGDTIFFTLPKGGLIRTMMMNHIIHHRAQLGVYYRLLGVPVPSIYGPSADEPM